MSINPSTTISVNASSGTSTTSATRSNMLSPDLSQCIYAGNGSIVSGVVISTRVYSSYGFSTNNYCVNMTGTVNIPSGEMFYEIIKSANVNIRAYDQINGNGTEIDYIPNKVKSFVISQGNYNSSDQMSNPGTVIGIVFIVIIIIILLSSGGYFGHKYYKKWRGHRRQSEDLEPVPSFESEGRGEGGGYHKIRY
jgi:hypothetical protein